MHRKVICVMSQMLIVTFHSSELEVSGPESIHSSVSLELTRFDGHRTSPMLRAEVFNVITRQGNQNHRDHTT